ncbi:glycosyltransferase [Clostridium estertheticum]|uniref:glycosyltransferase n=1 Tax=Clostridium estertheticum TaxID=238834 RepID=UPI001CF37643|nr:glycosyltransferase [Clostridium estertheticum]MCB2353560.1 glycosyltransferase [Clostridium estertheticum]WAG41895.1 glycosyltransferase [Clostridium estertheticum]
MNNIYGDLVFFTYVDNKNYNDIKEGGLSRYLGLYRYIESTSFDKRYVKLNGKGRRVINLIRIYGTLFFTRKCILIFQYPGLGIPIFRKNLIVSLIRKVFLKLLKFSSSRNKIYIDVADLPYEQSKALELNTNYDFNIFKNIETQIFSLENTTYVFASYSMRDYICYKYNLVENKTVVCVNGGHKLKTFDISKYDGFINKDKSNYIYAGTLNKGRQIEKLIGIFKKCPNCNLILIGINGEWIGKEGLPGNIQYLGSLEEEEAHELTSMCDVGIIPYDSDRFYYNIAYPTKLSFYITAGITFLSTKVREVQNINEKYNIGYTIDINDWENSIKNLSKREINDEKEKINVIKDNFYWKNIFDIIKMDD